MSDFNKGDFTQQGIDGHVRATLRLNEKRYVELDLTTNENARGCTISGNVHDRLNNLDYPIGAAPSGNIAITENTAEGEPLDVSQYATATVNVSGGGSSDLTTATVTLVNQSAISTNTLYINGCIAVNDPQYPTTIYQVDCEYGNTKTAEVIMFKGEATVLVQNTNSGVGTITATGSAQDGGFGKYYVTGDCTFTLTTLA